MAMKNVRTSTTFFNNKVLQFDGLPDDTKQTEMRRLIKQNEGTYLDEGMASALVPTSRLHAIILGTDGAASRNHGYKSEVLQQAIANFPADTELIVVVVSFSSRGDVSMFCHLNNRTSLPTDNSFFIIPDLRELDLDQMSADIVAVLETFRTPTHIVQFSPGRYLGHDLSERQTLVVSSALAVIVSHTPGCPDDGIDSRVRTVSPAPKNAEALVLALFTRVLNEEQMASVRQDETAQVRALRLETWLDLATQACTALEGGQRVKVKAPEKVLQHRWSRLAHVLVPREEKEADLELQSPLAHALRDKINKLRLQVLSGTKVTAAMMTQFKDLSLATQKRMAKEIKREKGTKKLPGLGLAGPSAEIVGDSYVQFSFATGIADDQPCCLCSNDGAPPGDPLGAPPGGPQLSHDVLVTHLIDTHLAEITTLLFGHSLDRETMCGHSALTLEDAAEALTEVLLTPELRLELAKKDILWVMEALPLPSFYAQVTRDALSSNDPYFTSVKVVPGMSLCAGEAMRHGGGQMVAPGREVVNAVVPMLRNWGVKKGISKLALAHAGVAIRKSPSGLSADLAALQMVTLASAFPPASESLLSQLRVLALDCVWPPMSRWKKPITLDELLDGFCTDAFATLRKRANQLFSAHKVLGIVIAALLCKPEAVQPLFADQKSWHSFSRAVALHLLAELVAKSKKHLKLRPLVLAPDCVPPGNIPTNVDAPAAIHVDAGVCQEFWENVNGLRKGNLTWQGTIEMLHRVGRVGRAMLEDSSLDLAPVCREASASSPVAPLFSREESDAIVTNLVYSFKVTLQAPSADPAMTLELCAKAELSLWRQARLSAVNYQHQTLRYLDKQARIHHFASAHHGPSMQRTDLNEAAFRSLLCEPQDGVWDFTPSNPVEDCEIVKRMCLFPACFCMPPNLPSHFAESKGDNDYQLYVTAWHKQTKMNGINELSLEEFRERCEPLLAKLSPGAKRLFKETVVDERYWQVRMLQSDWKKALDVEACREETSLPREFDHIYYTLVGSLSEMQTHVQLKRNEHFERMQRWEEKTRAQRTCEKCGVLFATFGDMAHHLLPCFHA
jgi:hypothetical protein